MSLSSSVTCDVCGKRRGDRIGGWFGIDTGADSFSIFLEAECLEGIARTSKDICGSRCLCVALERWIAKKLKTARAAALADSVEHLHAEPLRIGPRIAPTAAPSARETHQRGQSKVSKSPPPLESFVPGEGSRILEVFRKAVNR